MPNQHHQIDPLIRFEAKVEKTDSCWLWRGNVLSNGYGQFWSGTSRISAHRFSYITSKGPIPEGLCIDHLCRVRNCVRPEHLEAVTPSVNVLRGIGPLRNLAKTHCPQGHPYAGSNLIEGTRRRHRACRLCARAAKKRSTEKTALSLYRLLESKGGTKAKR